MLNGSMVNGSSSTASNMSACNQCGEKRTLLPYIFPTQNGKREFCSEPCLSAYRCAQKGLFSKFTYEARYDNEFAPVCNLYNYFLCSIEIFKYNLLLVFNYKKVHDITNAN